MTKLDGQIAVSGFSGDPTVVRDGNVVTIEAEGLKLVFNGARVDTNNEELVITTFPADEFEE